MKFKMYKKYLGYVLRHKWWVFYAGVFKMGIKPWNFGLFWRLIKHDWSKFLPCEMVPYANNFSRPWPNNERPPEVKESFEYAWLHHQKLNDHHWQYWILKCDTGKTKVLNPDDDSVIEMVADWAGAGRAITGKWEVSDWYLNNQDIIELHPEARDFVESLLELFF